MSILLTSSESKQLDALAEQRFGLSIELLMENAGRSVAELAAPLCASGRVVVFVGPGNNGGDGLVAARHLAVAGLNVEVALAVPATSLKGVAALNLERWRKLGEPVQEEVLQPLNSGDLAIDALLGTGLSRAPEGRLRDAIRHLNGRPSGTRVAAVDLPSGLDADSGRPPGDCVRADLTVALGAAKRGLWQEPGTTLAGRIAVGSLGLSGIALNALGARAQLLDLAHVQSLLPPRDASAFKNAFGHLLVVAGSPGKTGAAALAVKGALRSGAGLVTLVARRDVLAQALPGQPEAMSEDLGGEGPLGPGDVAQLWKALSKKQALAIGPGLGTGPGMAKALGELLVHFDGKVVLDADALNAVAGDRRLLAAARAETVITPHPGEMGRLCGKTSAEVQADRFGIAVEFAHANLTVVVLKGAKTVIAAPDGRVAVVPTGNAGLAHGGTGDVLCGIIGGLLAQGLPVFDAACAGAYLHGLAGDRLLGRCGQRGLAAGDLAEELGRLWAELGL